MSTFSHIINQPCDMVNCHGTQVSRITSILMNYQEKLMDRIKDRLYSRMSSIGRLYLGGECVVSAKGCDKVC